jgi:hypothetical protein
MEQILTKYIITNGCSFTRQYRRIGISGTAEDFLTDPISQWKWPHFMQKEYPEYKVINYGCPTNDNEVIAKSTLYGIDKLLKEGINPKDIKVMVQWSGWARSSFFISKDKQHKNNYFLNKNFIKERDKDTYPINESFAHVNDFIDDKKLYPGEHGYYVLSGGYHCEHVTTKAKEFFDDYVEHIFSADERMIQFFQSILLVQSFCKANGIEYMFFNMHNNFSIDYRTDDRFPLFAPIDSKKSQGWHVLYDKFIPITWENDKKIQFENEPHIKWLYDMIDFDKFWFYKKDGITKFGGQVEWSIQTYNFDEISDDAEIPNIIWQEYIQKWNDRLTTKEDILEHFKTNNFWQHTAPYMNKKFVKEVLVDFLGKPYKKMI